MLQWSVPASLAGDFALIALFAGLGGWLFRRLGQPAVVGEVLVGVLLGPTLLGSWSEHLFPAGAQELLEGLARVAVVVFMFVVGLEVEVDTEGASLRIATWVGVAGSVVPFLLGLAVAPLVEAPDGVSHWTFAVFLGAVFSVTAFPVLARIVEDLGWSRRPLGRLVMLSAAIDDAITWVTLAAALALASAGDRVLWEVALGAVVLAVAALGILRPVLARVANRVDLSSAEAFPFLLFIAFGLSWAGSGVGMRGIYGAFLAGLVVPRSVARVTRARLMTLTAVLLPTFFVSTGLTVNLRELGASSLVLLFGLLLVATIGKVTPGWAVGRLGGLAHRDALALGVFINTRGLTEIVVLGVGYEVGLIDERLFAVLLSITIITTVATAPIVRRVAPDPDLGQPPPQPDLSAG